MLHELLFALSGHPSPLLSGDSEESKAIDKDDGIRSLLSPAELALLKTLSVDLGEKHRDIREHADDIVANHHSTVCRAVAAGILSTHLAQFQAKILDVERSILKEDPSFVGAYKAVPLSAIVSAFDGWGRKLQWLWDIIQYIEEEGKTSSLGYCTAAMMIQRLRDAMRTGFPEIESMATNLVEKAEMAWLKQLSAWILYGRHPGGTDFLVRIHGSADATAHNKFNIDADLIPCFVTSQTASSILFVGKSLNHLKDRQLEQGRQLEQINYKLISSHLSHLSALRPPIRASNFSAAITAIRLSLSQNSLQKLLPISKVMEALQILKDFFLLERGEFASALITAADTRISHRHAGLQGPRQGTDVVQDLASLTIREGEVSNVLSRTWAALSSINDFDDEAEDEVLELARETITLSIKGFDASMSEKTAKDRTQTAVSFDDLLLPSPTTLNMHVSSPLDLFLSPSDVQSYSSIHAYLLAIRRSHLHLSQLFQLSRLRRQRHRPKPSSQASTSPSMEKSLRPVWATVSSATFFLTDLSNYLQGEVVKVSWLAFQDWVVPSIPDPPGPPNNSGTTSLSTSFRPGSSSHKTSRPTSSSQSNEITTYGIHDPETLAQAHRTFLSTLRRSLLLEDGDFTKLLRRHMTAIDHLCALMHRLETVHAQIGTAQLDTASSHSIAEQDRILADLKPARTTVAEGTQGLINRLREMEDVSGRGGGALYAQAPSPSSFEPNEAGGSGGPGVFVPWTPTGLDRLLLKFDYANVEDVVPAHFSGS